MTLKVERPVVGYVIHTQVPATHAACSGSIPEGLGRLSQLQSLDLRCNNLTGEYIESMLSLRSYSVTLIGVILPMRHSCIIQVSSEFTIRVLSCMGGVALDVADVVAFSAKNEQHIRRPRCMPFPKRALGLRLQ